MSNIILPKKGMAAFLEYGMLFVMADRKNQEQVAEKNMNFKLAIDASDFPDAALIHFHDGTFNVLALSPEDVKDKTKWDAKLTGTGPVFINYFLNRLGAIRPLLFGKIKPDSLKTLIKLLDLLWFVKMNMNFFGKNSALARGVFWSFYNKK
jgi:hypothetical protein